MKPLFTTNFMVNYLIIDTVAQYKEEAEKRLETAKELQPEGRNHNAPKTARQP